MDIFSDAANSDWLWPTAAFSAAALCVWAAGTDTDVGRFSREARFFWLGLAGFMLLLGVGRQFEIGSGISDLARKVAWTQGWYDRRGAFQEDVTRVVLAGGVALISLGVWFLLGSSPRRILAFAAVVYLASIVIVRAVSLHSVDQLLYSQLGGNVQLNSVLELAGVVAVAAAAAATVRRGRSSAEQARRG